MSQIREREADVEELVSLNEDMAEYFSEEEDEDVPEKANKVGRGRPRQQERWSRVISFTEDNLVALQSHELAADLLLENAIAEALNEPMDGIEW